MANIYDVNAAIERPNLLGTALAGLRVGNEQRALREQRADEATLRQLAPGIMSGDTAALEQAAVIDPARAGQYKAAGDVKWQTLKGGYDMVKRAQASGNPQAVQNAWAAFRPFIQRATGTLPPEDFATAAPHFDSLGVKLATIMGGAEQQPDVKVVGDALVDATGKVLYQGQPQSKFFQTDQGLVEVAPGGQPREVRLGGSAAPDPQRADMEADIALANEMIAAGIPAAQVDAFLQSRGQRAEQAPADAGRPLLPAASLESRQRLELSQAADRRAEEAAERARQAQARADREAQLRQQFGTIPPGFRINAAGTAIERVPGSPQDGGKPLPQGTVDKLTKDAAKLENLTELAGGFADTYAGNKVGGSLENLAGRLGGEAFGISTPGQASWWQQYDRYKNEIRNELFGASLTAGKQAAFEAADITPNMDPKVIRRNMQKQAAVIQGALQRKANTWAAQGYNREAIEAATGLAPKGAAPQSPAAGGSGGQASPPRRATNPQTGESLILVNGQWVPE